MPALDSCVTSLYSPLNTTANSGATPVRPVLDTLLDPDTYNPEDVTYSFDQSKFYNSFYMGAY